MKKKPESPALTLIRHTWEHACKATTHSWERLNHAMHDSLKLAISGGLEFDAGDMKTLFESFRSGYWIGASSEWIYTLAVADENISAVESYEAATLREPIRADDIEARVRCGMHGDNIQRGRERLFVGATFTYGAVRPTVTSFDSDGNAVACTYHKRNEGEYGNKVLKRYRVSQEDIVRDRAERKERTAAALAMKARSDDAIKLLAKAGVKTEQQFAELPIAKVRKLLAEFNAQQA